MGKHTSVKHLKLLRRCILPKNFQATKYEIPNPTVTAQKIWSTKEKKGKQSDKGFRTIKSLLIMSEEPSWCLGYMFTRRVKPDTARATDLRTKKRNEIRYASNLLFVFNRLPLSAENEPLANFRKWVLTFIHGQRPGGHSWIHFFAKARECLIHFFPYKQLVTSNKR